MKERLDLTECQKGFAIAWFVDGEEGLWLGQPALDDGSRNAVQAILKTFPEVVRSGSGELLFDSLSAAKMALRVARAAVKSSSKPLPAWAATALANGWKCPKGWRP